jgi:gentisate 1,2-dioxygenase
MQPRTISVEQTAERQAFYERLPQYGLAPLWQRIGSLLTEVPETRSQPFLWDYEVSRPLLMTSTEIISAAEAERRVLILENPGLVGDSAITETLYAGWQVVMPGEVAPAHRHSPSALRFILEGGGRAYTAVDGEKAYMKPGDMILTPSMRWHDHGNEGQEPVVWLDVLDMPHLINMGPIFLDLHAEERFPVTLETGRSAKIYGRGIRPVGDGSKSVNSPMFHYPYQDVLAALNEISVVHPAHGVSVEYIDPTTGRPALSTISTYMRRFPAGFVGRPFRTTEGQVYSVVEGRGTVSVEHGGKSYDIDFKPRDTFVIPCWANQAWAVDGGAVVFCASDRGLQERIGVFREEWGE